MLFLAGFCIGRLFEGNFQLSAIGGCIFIVLAFIYVVSTDTIVKELKEMCRDLLKEK
jgi:hypothetical protein